MRNTPLRKAAFSALALLSFSFLPFKAEAKDLVTSDSDVREELLRRAVVWQLPKWISKDFRFDPSFDVAAGPELKGDDRLLLNKDVYCQVTEEDLKKPNGKTPKFECRLLRLNSSGQFEYVKNKNGKTQKLKVKFRTPEMGNRDSEVETEILATRLLWSLGFGADQMYSVSRLHCYGCTENPFKNRKLDASTMKRARIFENAAVEIKLEGDEITYKSPPRTGGIEDHYRHDPPREGFTLTELVNTRARDNDALKDRQRIERDALRLLAVFMQNADLKSENFRLTCAGDKGNRGLCRGDVIAYMQDPGGTFGQGSTGLIGIDKLDLSHWASRGIWKNPRRCIGRIGKSLDFPMMYPQVTNEGRVLLARLLSGFAEGREGRARVEALFNAAKIPAKFGSTRNWADAFVSKVEQIKYPMGRENPNYVCTKTVD